MTDIDQTLQERGTRYGEFPEHARITQNIKRAMIDSPNWKTLADDQKEALEMLAHKAGRILNGDPNYHDSWHDIIGYTKLVADRLLNRDPLTHMSPEELARKDNPAPAAEKWVVVPASALRWLLGMEGSFTWPDFESTRYGFRSEFLRRAKLKWSDVE